LTRARTAGQATGYPGDCLRPGRPAGITMGEASQLYASYRHIADMRSLPRSSGINNARHAS
jgi:hypothetical protein